MQLRQPGRRRHWWQRRPADRVVDFTPCVDCPSHFIIQRMPCNNPTHTHWAIVEAHEKTCPHANELLRQSSS